MKKLLVVLLLFCGILLGSCVSVSTSTTTKLKNVAALFTQADAVSMEMVAFEALDKLAITDGSKTPMGFYQRIANPNNAVRGARVYSTDGTLLYSIIPTFDTSGRQILFSYRSAEQAAGTISIQPQVNLNGFGASTAYQISADFFGVPLQWERNESSKVSAGLGSMSIQSESQSIFYEGSRPVLAVVRSYDSDRKAPSTTQTLAEHDALQKNRGLVACLLVTQLLLDEVNAEVDRLNPSRRSGAAMNTDGTFNNNGNPADSF